MTVNINGQECDPKYRNDYSEAVISDSLNNYPAGTIEEIDLDMYDSVSGEIEIIDQGSVKATITENLTHECTGEFIPLDQYDELLTDLVTKRSKDIGDVTLIDYCDPDYDYTVRYSSIIKCNSISEATMKAKALHSEIVGPLNDAVLKVNDFLLKELGL